MQVTSVGLLRNLLLKQFRSMPTTGESAQTRVRYKLCNTSSASIPTAWIRRVSPIDRDGFVVRTHGERQIAFQHLTHMSIPCSLLVVVTATPVSWLTTLIAASAGSVLDRPRNRAGSALTKN